MSKFKSNLEAKFYQDHRLPYETTTLQYVLTHQYTPDWQVTPTAFIETKGLWSGQDRNKILAVKKQHPEITVLMAFQQPNRKLSKTSKTTYSGWCEKRGIPWCASDDRATIQKFITEAKDPRGTTSGASSTET